MPRDLHSEMLATAQDLSQTGTIAPRSQRKLSQIFTIVFVSPHPRAHSPPSLQPSTSLQSKQRRPRTEIDKNYRLSNARKVYQKALQRGGCYFLVFALCVTPTDCRDPETALWPEQDQRTAKIRSFLHNDTLAMFKERARFNGYHDEEAFVRFIEQLSQASPIEKEVVNAVDVVPEKSSSSNTATSTAAAVEMDIDMREEVGGTDPRRATSDFEVVNRIIRERGVAEDPTIQQAMKILFPEAVYTNWKLTWCLPPTDGGW